jgi:hypothetical protein
MKVSKFGLLVKLLESQAAFEQARKMCVPGSAEFLTTLAVMNTAGDERNFIQEKVLCAARSIYLESKDSGKYDRHSTFLKTVESLMQVISS